MVSPALYTIGHSNRALEDFAGLLSDYVIDLVVDVRKLPGSNRYPQFNEETLTVELEERGVSLRRLEVLTGRRPVSTTIPGDVNAWWQNRSFHNYADHALSDEFQAGIKTLREWSTCHTAAIMCSEAVWWRCHRRIITDYLLAAGHSVFHIIGAGQVQPAELNAGAVVNDQRTVLYPEN